MAQMVERPSDLAMAPDEGLPPPSAQAMGGGMGGGMGAGMQGGPGAIEALKKGISYLLQFMEPEQLLEALLKLAQTQDLPVDENQLRALVEGAGQGGAPQGGPPAGGPPMGGQPMGQPPINTPGQLQP